MSVKLLFVIDKIIFISEELPFVTIYPAGNDAVRVADRDSLGCGCTVSVAVAERE